MKNKFIILHGGVSEVSEKKSRFLAKVYPVHSPEEMQSFLAAQKKQYWDARHHCYACVLGPKEEWVRSSDDGEPSGTAGRPILDRILARNVYDVLVVVTRYFGGTLLGTGGLVRAYGQAAGEALQASELLEQCEGYRVAVETDYAESEKLRHIMDQSSLNIENIEYTERVKMIFLVKKDEKEKTLQELREITQGRCQIDCSALLLLGWPSENS